MTRPMIYLDDALVLAKAHRASEAHIDRLRAMPAVTVGIKPLVWEGSGSGWRAVSIAGHYLAFKTNNPRTDRYMVTCVCLRESGNIQSLTIGYFDGIDAAKAAAEADWQAKGRAIRALIGEGK